MKDTFYHVGYTLGCGAQIAAIYCAWNHQPFLMLVGFVAGAFVMWFSGYGIGRNQK